MKLPLLLAGPIVRRATPEKIWVWIATTDLLPPPHLELYEYRGSSAASKWIASEPEWYPVALGQRLWVYLLAAVPAKPLTPGIPYEYDVQLSGLKKPLFGSEDLKQIVLPGFHRPSFVLGYPDRSEMHALYASCRKLHGPGRDMMKAAEQILNKARSKERPQYFFLGGDQIYADDVHPDFLTFTQPLRDALFRKEVIPGINPLAYTLSGDRSKYLKSFFTSGEMEHHLLTFAEYATTYLMAWNGELWASLSQRGSVLETTNTVPGEIGARYTRKALANIICYMIFDDHEITDDWFLNESWETNAAKQDAAIRIIANGMAAYWAFQGWGNDPDAFDDAYRSTIGDFAAGAGRNTESAWKALRSTAWSFVSPTSPPALFLDTRTRRESSPKVDDHVGSRWGSTTVGVPRMWAGTRKQTEKMLLAQTAVPRDVDAPRLLGPEARARVAELIGKHARRNRPLIVVAPAPVFGYPPMEWLQGVYGGISPPGADFESWSGNPRNTLDAAGLLSKPEPKPLIILSGDVHYGFEVVGRIISEAGSVPFLQLCSSALKNSIEGGKLWFFNFLSLFGEQELPFLYWDLREEGKTDGRIAYANENTEGRAARVFLDTFGGLFGDHEVTMIHSQFIQRSDREGSQGLIEKQNNLGELVVSESSVSHRHWYADKSGKVQSRDYLTWDSRDWPVKDIVDILLETSGLSSPR